MFGLLRKKTEMPTAGTGLAGRANPIPTAETNFVTGRPLKGPFPDGLEQAMFGMGCFWGVERKFWKLPGVVATAAVDHVAGLFADDVVGAGRPHDRHLLAVALFRLRLGGDEQKQRESSENEEGRASEGVDLGRHP